MNITEVRIYPMNDVGSLGGRLKATANVTIDNAIAIHGVRVLEGDKGMYIGMPSRKLPKGNYVDVVHPINSETREMLSKAVLEAYDNHGNM